MEATLSALKVTELKALLQQAQLPATGNKADLVARLLQHPQATSSLGGGAEAPAAAAAQPEPSAPAQEEDLLEYEK